MRFRTRAFLLCFVPFAVLLTLSFATIQVFVQATVRDGLRRSLRENQAAMARLHAKSDLQNSRFLKVAGENASLMAGMDLLRAEPGRDARRTVEDQLREMGEHMGFDFLLVSSPSGTPLAGVVRQAGQLVPRIRRASQRAGQAWFLSAAASSRPRRWPSTATLKTSARWRWASTSTSRNSPLRRC